MEIKRAGHPMENDLIVVFCNPHNRHWFLIIVDNREGPTTWKQQSGCNKRIVPADEEMLLGSEGSSKLKGKVLNFSIQLGGVNLTLATRKKCKNYIDFINNYSQFISNIICI